VRILYVGRIHPEKGLRLLAKALRLIASGDQARKWECVLVGPVLESQGGGGEAFAGELRRLFDGLPVRFSPPVFDPAELARIYDDADIFVYPSVAEKGESFGLAPLEAMARGVLPVVSELSVFRDYADPGVNAVVFDHRSLSARENLARALQLLLEDSRLRQLMGTAARGKAMGFSTAAIAERYLQLFAKTLESAA